MVNDKNNSRDFNMDLLRILASFMVIVIHVSAYNWDNAYTRSFDWIVYNIYDSMVRAAVPIFLMISGTFFLTEKIQNNIKRIYFKNIFKLIIVYLFWSATYLGYMLFFKKINLDLAIETFISGHFHMWYIPIIISMYIISPIIYRIVKNSDTNIFRYFIWIFVSACFLKTVYFLDFIPKISYIKLIIDKLSLDIICNFYSYFLLGYFLYNYEMSEKTTKFIYVAAWISVLLCAFLTYSLSIYSGNKITYFYKIFSIFTLLEAMGLFLYFKNKKFVGREVYKDTVINISNCTLGTYLIHMLVIYILFDNKIIQITDFNTVLSVPIISILTFIISMIITKMIKKLKLMGKWIV